MHKPLVRVDGVAKAYGPVHALKGVSIEFNAGEIHAVLGENGAGKSTLMGVLSGFVTPDAGQVTIEGRPIEFGRPQTAKHLGVRIVHQHFMLAPGLSVQENLALSGLTNPWSVIDLDTAAAPAEKRAASFGWALPKSRQTGSLPVGVRQRIEIIKALTGTARLLILDEPTAVLTPEETEDVFAVLQNLKSDGIAIALIAHKLSEVMAVADRVTVLRNGSVTGSAPIDQVDAGTLVQWMVGESVATAEAPPESTGTLVLDVAGLSAKGDQGQPAVQDVSFQVRSGEVLGIGGVDGNGQVELAEAIVGIRPCQQGKVLRPDNVAYIPQDRQTDGLAVSLSVEENLLLGQLPKELKRGPFIVRAQAHKRANRLVESHDVRTASLSQPVSSLSGGNQQKLVVARELDKDPDLIVAVNPTRGLDVKAAAAVTSKMLDHAKRGAAILLVSTDRDELSATAHRRFTLSHGRLEEAR